MSREPSSRALVAVGAAGSLLVTVSSYWVGATPLVFRTDPPAVVDVLAQGSPAALVVWYLGLAAMCLAWLGFGRRLWRGEDVGAGRLRTAGLVSAAPLLLATPLMSRDLWAYAAQARIAAAGLDPYTVTPLAFHDPSLQNVSARWVDTPSPYGPLWTLAGRGLEAVTGQHALLQVLVLRLPAAVGFVLLALCVPALARRLGADQRTATWLVVANPVVVLHGVGGGHNDTLMVGLLAAGLLVAVSGGPRWRALLLGGVLVGLAASIKIPAVVAAPFLPLLSPAVTARAAATVTWRQAVRERGRDVVVGTAVAVAGAVVALLVCTLAAGHGLAWLSAANSDDHGGGPATTAALAVVLVALWLLAVRGAAWWLLSAALLAPALVNPLSLAWYWFWPLVPLAVVVRGRLTPYLLAVGSVALVLVIRPNGPNFGLRPELVIVVVAVVAWLVLDRHWRPFADGPAGRPLSRSSKT